LREYLHRTRSFSLAMVKIALGAALIGAAFSQELGDRLRMGHPNHANFGNHLERTFTVYSELPMGEEALHAAGWHKHGATCDPALGYAWTQDASGATKDHPMKLYTTEAGQPSGVGIIIRGNGQEPLPEPQKKWSTEAPLVEPKSDPQIAHIDVAFRSGDVVCSGERGLGGIGDTLIVNPNGSNKRVLPLTQDAAHGEGWKRGSCFDGMGWHYFLDTSTSGGMSWQAKNLFPVVTMFHQGQINAIFFASTINQVSVPIFQSNEWEPKSLSSVEMCKNMCDKDCHFSGLTSAGPFSTAHIYFRYHSEVTCEKDLRCGLNWPLPRGNCCESDVVV